MTTLTPPTLGLRGPVIASSGQRIFARSLVLRAETLRYDESAKRYALLLPGVYADSVAFAPDGRSIAYTTVPDHSL